jgi:hypothetical protein
MNGLKEFVKRAMRLPANLIVGSSTNLQFRVEDVLKDAAASVLIEEPAMAAKFLPYLGGKRDYILYPTTEFATTGNKELPNPAQRRLAGICCVA